MWSLVLAFVCCMETSKCFRAPVYISPRDIQLPVRLERLAADGEINSETKNISLAPSDWIMDEHNLRYDTPIHGISIRPESDESPSFWVDGQSSFFSSRTRQYLSIGPESFLVRTVQTISIVRNFSSQTTGRFSIGEDAAQDFERSCIPHSVFVVPILPGLFGGSNHFFGRFQLINRTDDSVASETVRNPIRLVSSSWILSVTGPIGHIIDRSLVSRGAMQIHGVYHNCQLDHLPQLNLVFDYGTISLAPHDYFHFDPVAWRCTPLYRIARHHENVPSLNPLLIRDVNVRFREEELTFCDTSIQ